MRGLLRPNAELHGRYPVGGRSPRREHAELPGWVHPGDADARRALRALGAGRGRGGSGGERAGSQELHGQGTHLRRSDPGDAGLPRQRAGRYGRGRGHTGEHRQRVARPPLRAGRGQRGAGQPAPPALELSRRRAEFEDRRNDFTDGPSSATRDALTEARSNATVAKLRLSTLQSAYQMSRQSAGSAALVEIIERAVEGRSDGARVTQFLLFVAVLAGLAVGIALALLRAHRQARLLPR
jgi:hypothetical protein